MNPIHETNSEQIAYAHTPDYAGRLHKTHDNFLDNPLIYSLSRRFILHDPKAAAMPLISHQYIRG